jgi:serine/threonine-protein kinase
MSLDSIDTLLAILRRTGLFGNEQISEIQRELVPFYTDPVSLGEYLVEIDWLTAYQLQRILSNRWDELTIGTYQILDRLGEGGISEVFKAWDTVKGRTVALKVLRQHLAKKKDIVRQLQREMHLITRFSHPNIIKTFDARSDGGVHYFAMEYIEGMDLDKYVRQIGILNYDQACDYLRQAATGLQHAHQSALVHRDIKPANLFLLHPPMPQAAGAPPKRGPDPVVKVLDWGLARCLKDGPDDEPTTPVTDSEFAAEKGALVGTADYIAPEQSRDPTLVDIRADIYSLGCTLYFMLTGHPPFAGSLMQKILHHQESPPPSVRAERPDVPEELDLYLQKMMAKKPEDRPQIPLLVITQLRKFCPTGIRPTGSHNGTIYRPGSSANINTPSSANLPRPGSSLNISRPSTSSSLQRPGTTTNLPRPKPDK